MRKFLQKTLAVLVLVFLGMSAWAETVTFDLTSISYGAGGSYGTPITQNGVSVSSTTWAAELFGDGSWAKVKVEGVEADISQIVLALRPYDSDSYCAIDANTGTFSGRNEFVTTVTWVNSGNAKSVVFTSAYDSADFYIISMTVTYTPAAASTTFEFSSTNIKDGDVYTSAVTGGLTLNHGETLSFAAGKSASDITVNGTPMAVDTYVLFNIGQTWINYTFSEDGTNTIEIPEGVFVNGSGKTNEALTISFTINYPFFTMSSAEWTSCCLAKNWTMPTNYDGYVVSSYVDGYAILTKQYPAGDVVPANVAVLINGPEATKVIPADGFYPSYSTSNYLCSPLTIGIESTVTICDYHIPMYWDTKLDGESDCYLYKLSYDSEGKNLGFYWDSANGKSVTCKPNKAFLVVPASIAAASNGLKIRIADHTSGISTIVSENSNAIYNLQGQRVNAAKAGVYIKNGKKFIVK